MDYRKYMEFALVQARLAAEAGEVPVGAVIVRDGEVIAAAYNRVEGEKCAMAHAEMLALRQAEQHLGRKFLSDCTMFVTLEPCPMCAGALVLARLGAVVFGAADSLWGGCGSIFDVPEHRQTGFRVQVVGGICEDECRELLQGFFRERRG